MGRATGRCCRGVEAASKRRCASRPREGVRPARLEEPQKQHLIHSPILGSSSSAPPSRRLKRRCARGRRFCESRYSLLTYSSSPPAESSNELRRVAALRLPGRRTARLCESQEQRLFCQVQPCRPSGSKPAGPTATSVAGLRWGRLRPARLCEPQKHSTHSSHNFLNFGLSPIPPKPLRGLGDKAGDLKVARAQTIHRPRLSDSSSARPPLAPLKRRPCRGRRFLLESRYSLSPQIPAQSSPQFSAPCPPHCGSAFAPPRFRAPARFILFRLTAEIAES